MRDKKKYSQYQREYFIRKTQRLNNRCPACQKLICPNSKFCNRHTPRPWTRKERHNITDCAHFRDKAGYINLYYPEHPNANKSGQVGEHIVVWVGANGILPLRWQVHHINGVKGDNRLENLIALPPKTHRHSSPIKLLLKKAQAKIRELEAKFNNQLHL